MIYIYALIDPRTNEIKYIGHARNVDKRYKQHCDIMNPKYSNLHKKNWIKQLFDINLKPIIRVIEECDNSNYNLRERYWIKYYRDLGCKLTNLTDGGEGNLGYFPSKFTRKKMSDARRKWLESNEHYMKGKHPTEETRKKMSLSKIGLMCGKDCPMYGRFGDKHPVYGKHKTEEQKEVLRQLNLGKNNPRYGVEVSEETKIKMSESQKKAWLKRKNKINHID